MSYADLDTASDRLAASLAAAGIVRGDRVLVFMDNCWEAAVSIFAILKAGAVVQPDQSIDQGRQARLYDRAIARRARILTQTQAAGPSSPRRSPTHPPLPSSFIAGKPSAALPEGQVLSQTASQHGATPVNIAASMSISRMLIYTSGSTGRPKGVMMTHRNIEAAATSITTYLENRGDDIILNVLPLAFDYGLYQLLMAVKLGATLVLEKSFAFPQAIFDLMREEKVTGLPLVPTMAAHDPADARPRAGLPSRACATSPTPRPPCRPPILRACANSFPARGSIRCMA